MFTEIHWVVRQSFINFEKIKAFLISKLLRLEAFENTLNALEASNSLFLPGKFLFETAREPPKDTTTESKIQILNVHLQWKVLLGSPKFAILD